LISFSASILRFSKDRESRFVLLLEPSFSEEFVYSRLTVLSLSFSFFFFSRQSFISLSENRNSGTATVLLISRVSSRDIAVLSRGNARRNRYDLNLNRETGSPESRAGDFSAVCTLYPHFSSTVRTRNGWSQPPSRVRSPPSHSPTRPHHVSTRCSRWIRVMHCYLPWLDRRAIKSTEGRRPKVSGHFKTDTCLTRGSSGVPGGDFFVCGRRRAFIGFT